MEVLHNYIAAILLLFSTACILVVESRIGVLTDLDNDILKFDQSNHFDWYDCGDDDSVIRLTDFTLSPDPVQLPGDVSVSFSGYSTEKLVAPIKVSVEVHKKEVFWIHIPCVDGVGSCTYDDICTMVDPSQCPEAFKKHHIPCECPIKAGNYSLPLSTVPVAFDPSSLEKGSYKVEVKFEKDGDEIGCVHMSLEME